ncbi:MAG: SHOCT domain-containing protein [Thomasclavelia spiroformis]
MPQENQKNASVIDEIKEYAKLMQEGLITEEEYNQKKKQLLGI